MKLNIMPHGWMAKKTEITGRPKTRFFKRLAVVWAVIAVLGAPCLLPWHDSEFLGIGCLAPLIVVPEFVFIGLAIFFRFTERPQKMIVSTPPVWPGPIIH